MHPWKKINKHENQDRGADKPITVQEQHTAWKSRGSEYGAVGLERKDFFHLYCILFAERSNFMGETTAGGTCRPAISRLSARA
jgi:hypothetical protein